MLFETGHYLKGHAKADYFQRLMKTAILKWSKIRDYGCRI